MRLDVIPVAAAVLLLDHVPGLDQVRDDAEGAPLGDVQAVRDIAQTHSGVAGDQQQNPGMGGQEGPARHFSMLPISGKNLLASRFAVPCMSWHLGGGAMFTGSAGRAR